MKAFARREYENAAMVAARERRELGLFWARRCHKTTTIGSMAFDDMSSEAGRTCIAASASLVLGTEIAMVTTTAAEQALIVANEAAAMHRILSDSAEDRSLHLKCADSSTGKEYMGMNEADFAELYASSKMETRLYFDRTHYSRMRVIAPNPATARGWGGKVFRDEDGYVRASVERELRIATKPIIDTDPTFRIIYACNLCADDSHPWFEDTMPPVGQELPVNGAGNFYIGQTGMLIHRVTLADAYAAGHVLYDKKGLPLSYADFIAAPENKLGKKISYTLEHETGGTAAIDLLALLTAQQRGIGKCSFVFVDDDAEFNRAMFALRGNLGDGPVGVGMDPATTIKATSNPTSVTITESSGTERAQRMVICWKEKKAAVVIERLRAIFRTIAARPRGGAARRFCIAAGNERYFADLLADELRALVPVQLIIEGANVEPQPAGYEKAINWKTFGGDTYSAAVNENHYALPPGEYFKKDQRLTTKNAGRYECEPDADGAHGDTYVSGWCAELALSTGTPAMAGRIEPPNARTGTGRIRSTRRLLGAGYM